MSNFTTGAVQRASCKPGLEVLKAEKYEDGSPSLSLKLTEEIARSAAVRLQESLIERLYCSSTITYLKKACEANSVTCPITLHFYRRRLLVIPLS
jgi:hypothetical protein